MQLFNSKTLPTWLLGAAVGVTSFAVPPSDAFGQAREREERREDRREERRDRDDREDTEMQPVERADLPEAVRTAMQRNLPAGAKEVSYYRGKRDGQVVFAARFTDARGEKSRLRFDRDGRPFGVASASGGAQPRVLTPAEESDRQRAERIERERMERDRIADRAAAERAADRAAADRASDRVSDRAGDEKDDARYTEISRNDVPRRALAALEKHTTGARDLQYRREERAGGRTTYSVRYMQPNDKRYYVSVNEDGSTFIEPRISDHQRGGDARPAAGRVERDDDRANPPSRTDNDADRGSVRYQPVKRTDMPERVRDGFEKQVAGSTDIEYQRSTREGKTYYSAHYTKQGKRYEVRLNEQGQVVDGPQLAREQPSNRRL